MRCLLAVLAALACLVAASPAAAQLATGSSWPQVGHDPGLTRRALVTGSQTGTPAPGFPAPIFGGSLAPQQGNATAGPPAVYLDGNLVSGTNATNNDGVAQLDYVYAVDVPAPGTVRALFTAQGGWPYTSAFSTNTPAVAANGLIYIGGSDGNLWAVPPSGQARPAWTGPAGTNAVSSATIGANGDLYFSAGNNPNAPFNGGGNIYALDPATNQVLWSFPIPLGTSSPIAFDGPGNAYAVTGSFTSPAQLLSLTPNGQRRWAFVAPGQPGVMGAPMVYGNTVFVLAGNGNQILLYAVNIANGKQVWATPLRGNDLGAQPAPALGPSGNVIVMSNTTVTAVNRTTGRPAWAFPLPSNAFPNLPPLVDGSGDTYVTAGLEDGGGTVIAIGPTGQQLWEDNIGTASSSIFGNTLSGSPTGTTIGVDGSIYVAATDGKLYAFTDPS